MSHETLVDCIAEGMWNATPSHCEVSWREQLRLWPDAPETKAFLQHAEAAARAVRQHEASQPQDLVERVARIIAGPYPDEIDGGRPPKKHWEYCTERAKAAITIVRKYQAEQIQSIVYPATYEEQLAVVESMMTCYETPITQAAGYTRDLLRTIIALEKSVPSGFSYEDQAVPYAFLQWKGTDACFDLHCKCGAFCHWDGCFAYYVQCPHCKTTYQMPFNLFPREVTETDGHESKLLEPDETYRADSGQSEAKGKHN